MEPKLAAFLSFRVARSLRVPTAALVRFVTVGSLIGLSCLLPFGASAQLDSIVRGFLQNAVPAPVPNPPAYPNSYPAYRPAPQPTPGYSQYSAPPRYHQPPASADRRLVAEMQRMLNDLGYDAGTPDGMAGAQTVEALRAFQRDHGEVASGEITTQQVASIRDVWSERGQAAASSAPAGRGQAATGSSFDCARAATASERRICATPRLAQLDAAIADAFDQAKASESPAEQTSLLAEQRAWTRARDACGSATACLERSMAERLDQLQAMAPSGAAPVTAGGSSTTGFAVADTPGTAPQAQPDSADSKIAAANGNAAATQWELAVAQGLPAINLSQSGDALGFWTEGRTQVAQPIRNWTRAVRLLSVAVRAEHGETISDDEARDLACIFLGPDQRAALYTRSPLYGRSNDVCETATAVRPVLGIAHLLKEGGDAFRATALPDLLRQAPHLPMKLLLVFNATTDFDGYDKSRHGYKMDAGYQLKLLDSPLDTRLPDFWPISEDAAAAFEARERGNTAQTLRFALPVTITGAENLDNTAAAPINSNSGLPAGAYWRIQEGLVTLYEGSALEHPLYQFTLAQTGRSEPAPSAPTAVAGGSNEQTAIINGRDMAQRWRLRTFNGVPLLPAERGAGNDNISFNDLITVQQFSRAQQENWQRAILALGLAASPSLAGTLNDEAMSELACSMLPPTRQQALFGAPCTGTMAPVRDFALKDAIAAFRRSDLPAFIRSAPHLPLRIMLTVRLAFDAWDSQRGGFHVAQPYPDSPRVFGAPLPMRTPASWPATEQEARQFYAAPATVTYGVSSRPAFLAIPVTITGVAPPASGASALNANSLLGDRLPWQFEVGDVVLYGDANLTRKLYDYGSSLSLAATIAGTPAAESPRPVAPVSLNDDTAFLLLQRWGGPDIGGIDWKAAAQNRYSFENRFRTRPDWKFYDAWGPYFPPTLSGSFREPYDNDIAGYRVWTQKRVAAFPDTFVIRQELAPNSRGAIKVFDRLSASSWIGDEPRFNVFPQSLTDAGITAAQILPVEVRVPAINLPVLFAVPKSRDSYVLPVPQGIAPPQANNDATAPVVDVSVSVAGAQIVSLDPGGRRALVVRLNPVGAALRSGNTTLATAAFPPSAWPITVARGAVAAPLDTALIDLIVAAQVGDRLPPEAMAYLIIRRWGDENDTRARPADRFFPKGAPRPAAKAAADMAPAFVSWARSHAPQLPALVTISAHNIVLADSKGALPWWDFFCLGSSVPNLDTGVHSNESSLRDRKQRATGSNWSGLDEQKLARAEAQEKVLDTISFTSFRGTCGISENSLGFDDPLSVSMFIGHGLPVLSMMAVDGTKRLDITVTLKITSASLSAEPPLLESLLPPELARDWPHFQQQAVRKGDFVTLKADYVETRYVETGGKEVARQGADRGASLDSIAADLRVRMATISTMQPAPQPAAARVPAAVPAAVPTAASPAPTARVPHGESRAPFAGDLIGVRIGMDFADAEKIIRAHMTVGQVLNGAPVTQGPVAGLAPSGKLFVSGDGRELIAILDDPPTLAHRVVAAWRQIYAPPSVSVAAILPELITKYGTPAYRVSGDRMLLWGSDSGGSCVGAMLVQAKQRAPLSTLWPGDLSANAPSSLPNANVPTVGSRLTEAFQSSPAACGPWVTMQFFPAQSGYNLIEMTLTDHAAVERELEKAAGAAAAAHPPAAIKF